MRFPRSIFGSLTRLWLLAGFASALLFSTASAATKHVVKIENMQFSPAQLNIVAGDSIEFKNEDLFPHTATARKGAGFDSGLINPGDAWSVTIDQTGNIDYICTLHPVMKASITVSDDSKSDSGKRAKPTRSRN